MPGWQTRRYTRGMIDDRRVYHLTDPDLPEEARLDCCGPPEESTLVHCLHCGQEYESYQMIWAPFDDEERSEREPSGLEGFWSCPVEGCSGVGFTVDIWPVDPDYVDAETGEKYWHEDPPMIEGHDSDCECVECEMAREEQLAEWEREDAEYQRKVASGEIKPPQVPDEEIPF